MEVIEKNNCPNCGAPITSEICPYCNTATGINTAAANMEYEVIECKEARLGFFNTVFPMIFAVGFGFFGFVLPFALASADNEDITTVLGICSIFALIGVIAFIIVLINLSRYLIIKLKGKEIFGIVYGYMDDNLFINGNPAQIVKIKIDTNEGPKFILYQTGDIKQPYKINSQIKLKVYKNIFHIEKENKTYF